MALVVEDGTGKVDADAYVDIAFVTAYWAARGDTTWGIAVESAQEAAIINATSYIDLVSSGRAKGTPVSETQALVFPRENLPACAAGEVLPMRLLKAAAEYALRALAAPLVQDPTVDPSGRAIIRNRVKVGPIEKEQEFSALTIWRQYPVPDNLLACLLSPAPNAAQGRTVRA